MAKQEAIDGLIADFDAAFPGHNLEPLFRTIFGAMSDPELLSLVQKMETEEFIIPVIIPNLSNFKLNQQAILDFATMIGHQFFERIWLTDPSDPSKTFLTPKKYLVMDMVNRRQAQTLDDKMSIPKDDSIVDDLTGQSTGESKGSAITFPELQLLSSYGLDQSIIELIKVRGGDNDAYRAMEQQIIETGVGQLATGTGLGTRPKTTLTLATRLKSVHIGNNL